MQLHNLLRPLQKEANRLVKSFLDENPELMKKYVGSGVTAISLALAPLNVFMRHLVVVQGLDPDTLPGEKERSALLEALENFFEKRHEKSFDADYDFSWIEKRFEETRKTLNRLEMTKEEFMKLTDLAKMPSIGDKYTVNGDEAVMNDLPAETLKKEMSLTPLEDKIEVGADAIEALRKAVQNIEDLSEDSRRAVKIEKLKKISKKLKEDFHASTKQGIKTHKKKLNKGDKSGSGPKVNRIISAEPIKEGLTTLRVESDRKVRPPARRASGRDLAALVQDKKAQNKAILESTPEFKAQLKAKLEKATKLTQLMVEKGLCEVSDQARQDQINSMLSWGDNNFEALERVINKYGPTKDAIAENKFKGSFRRVIK
jgi:hypothetical protein